MKSRSFFEVSKFVFGLNALYATWLCYIDFSVLTVFLAYFAWGPVVMFFHKELIAFALITCENDNFKKFRTYLLWIVVWYEYHDLNKTFKKIEQIKNEVLTHELTPHQTTVLLDELKALQNKIYQYQLKANKFLNSYKK